MKSLNRNSDGTLTITAPVMIPNAKDCDYKHGEKPLTKKQIHAFKESYDKYQFIDHEHGLTKDGNRIGTPSNSFLLEHPTEVTLLDGSTKTYPTGTWMLTSTLTDENAIQIALDGGYTGYSPSVFSQKRADQYLEALKSDRDTPLPVACKSGLSSSGTGLIKDVIDPVVLSVSLVHTPCLHESKICTLGDEFMEEDVKSLKSKILTAMGMTEEAEVEALKSEVADLHSVLEDTKKEFTEALKSMQEEFKNALEEALTPVAEKSETETEEGVEEEPVAEKAEEEPTTEEEEVVEETEEEPEEVTAEKGHSKAEPIHDEPVAEKSKPQNIYSIMGRNPDGTRKK